MSKYKIEKGIPLQREHTLYPFGEMEIGDSFAVAADVTERRRVVSSAHSYGKKNGKKFSTRKTEDGYRCWRVE